MSTVPELDRKRRERGISVTRLLNAAGVHEDTWRHGKRGGNTREDTLRRLDAALEALHQHSRQARPPAAIAALIRSIEQHIVAAIGQKRRRDRESLISACDPRRARRDTLHPGRLRLFAIYVAAVELEIKNPEIARALGIERQAVKQGRDKIHELREDRRVDALIERVAVMLTGRAPQLEADA